MGARCEHMCGSKALRQYETRGHASPRSRRAKHKLNPNLSRSGYFDRSYGERGYSRRQFFSFVPPRYIGQYKLIGMERTFRPDMEVEKLIGYVSTRRSRIGSQAPIVPTPLLTSVFVWKPYPIKSLFLWGILKNM